MNLIDQNLTKIKKLCNTRNVLKLYVFGSIVSKNFFSFLNCIWECNFWKSFTLNPFLKDEIY